ncbi:D-alanine--D-alanine ligase [uncultured archaeon]|nr:D-alanine--D-alanine ligase [uncultured archaeon]
MKKALIYHTDVDPKTASPDDLDVFEEAKFISEIVSKLGYDPIQKPFSVKRAANEIKTINPLFIFNLVEVVDGKESLSYLAPELFENTGVPYTGCTKDSFVKAADKLSAKKILTNAGINTPYYLSLNNLSNGLEGKSFLVKSSIDHASKGLVATLHKTEDSLRKALQSKSDFFAEEYIDGREFNISAIGPVKNCTVLPLAEIVFKDWKKDKLKIVDYEAKWNADSHEYHATVRNFDFAKEDEDLLNSLRSMCSACWDLFDLRGYARVDFRVSEKGVPYVLEINANPCISPDAGFIAATQRAGMTYEQTIKRIIRDSCNID